MIAGYPSPAREGQPPLGIGGSEIQAHRVARLLTDRFRIHVLTQRPPGLSSKDVIDGVTIDRTPLRASGVLDAAEIASHSAAWWSGQVAIDATRIVATGMRLHRPNIIQGFQLNGVTLGAAALARMRRIPLVIKVAGRSNIHSLLASRTGRAKLSILTRSASALVAPSLACLDDLRALGVPEGKLHHIPNGVDVDLFRLPTSSERLAARKVLGWESDDFVFAWVGRLDRIKGFDRLREAWSRVVETRPQARLVIAGSGPDKALADSLSLEHPKSVTWLGMQEDVLPIYAAADAIVIASSSEGLSNTLLEGMAAGLPAVVSNIPENLEVNPGCSFLIPFRQESVDDLIGSLIAMLDRGRDSRERTEARSRAESYYSLGSVTDRWAGLYRAVAPVGSR